jgi:hypothetical protein
MSYLVNLTAISPRVRFSGSMTRDPEFPRIIMGGGITGKSHSFDFNLFCKFVSAYSNARFADPPIPQPLGDFNSFNLNVGRLLDSGGWTRIYLEITNLADSRYSTVVGYPDWKEDSTWNPPELLMPLQGFWKLPSSSIAFISSPLDIPLFSIAEQMDPAKLLHF